MTIVKIVVFYLLVPALLIGGCMMYQASKLKTGEEKRAEARDRIIGTDKGYIDNFVSNTLVMEIEEDGTVFLKGEVRNRGERDVLAYKVDVDFLQKGYKDRVVNLGRVKAGKDKKIRKRLAKSKDGAWGTVNYHLSIKEVRLEDKEPAAGEAE